MRNKNIIRLVVLTFGVLMLVLRPYMGRQTTVGKNTKASPLSSCNRMPRAIQKKDDHHEQQIDLLIMANAGQTIVPPVRKLFSNLSFYLPPFKTATALRNEPNKLLLPAQRYRYRLVSCFLI